MKSLSDFHVNIVGKGTTTLVFGHGFGSAQTAWQHQITAFKDHYRLILFDYIGCGQSNIQAYSPLYYASLERYRDDLLTIYATLALTDTIFIGHSMSGVIGLLASLVEPAYFRQLVLIGASPRYLNDGDYVGGFEPADLEQLYQAMADNYLGWANGFSTLAMANPERPELGRAFAHTLAAMRPDIAQSTARIIFEADFRAQLPCVRHPALVLQTQHDFAVPVHVGAYLAAQLPHGHFVRLPAAGHFPHMSAPDAVTAAIKAFVTTNHPD